MWSKAFANRVFTHLLTLGLALCAFLLYLWLVPPAPPPVQLQPGSVVLAPVPPKVTRNVKRVVEELREYPRIEFYHKPDLAVTLKMPEIAYQKDNVIAVAEVAPHRGKTTAIATIGQGLDNVYRGGILVRQEPVPFFQLMRDVSLTGEYWFAGRDWMTADVNLTFLRTGPVEWKAKGGVGLERDTSDLYGRFGVGVEWRF